MLWLQMGPLPMATRLWAQSTGCSTTPFSAEALDSHVHFQVLDLGRQLYIWLGAVTRPG